MRIVGYTTKQASEVLGVSLRTIQLWAENGVLKQWKTPGGHRRISKDSVSGLISEMNNAFTGDNQENTKTKQRNDRLEILVVEDDVSLLQLYKLNIEGWDIPNNLYLAKSGFEGLIELGRNNIDLLILDLRMEGIDGFKLIETLDKKLLTDEAIMQIVVVTGLDDDEINERGPIPESVVVYKKPIPFQKIYTKASSLALKKGLSIDVEST